ncbi:MAG TPA: hypothetical protein VF557_11940 [Jatrophihabitans sp.]|jgi:hypothetical protein|uniref:hypothetical protein n=1 Tax=Jatrophihabitans sp. TaxID=1932789 RepID=UPI002EF643F4
MTSQLQRLLAQLDARLAAAALPIAGALRPGAPADRVITGAGDVTDLIAWWTWHDGAEAPDAPPVVEGPGVYELPETYLPGDWHILSLADAIRIHDWYRADLAAIGGTDLIPAAWFPLLKEDSVPAELWYDRDGGGLYMVDMHAALPEDPPVPMHASMTELVESLIDYVDTPEPGSRNRQVPG